MQTLASFLSLATIFLLCGCQSTETGSVPSAQHDTWQEQIDITNADLHSRSADCADYVAQYVAYVDDTQRGMAFIGSLSIEVGGGKCRFSSNNIPNHDFNGFSATFATPVMYQNTNYEITAVPAFAPKVTLLSLETDNAIMLNGVKMDVLAAACYGVGDGKSGCSDMSTPWRYDPMSPKNGFGTDSHNAHTQPDGAYHYHGSPLALYDAAGIDASPVIGFAADGFPLFGPYFDDNGTIRTARSSYRLKSGERHSIDGVNPGGRYDGTFRDDYEYVEGAGDLDECNGMERDGTYGYYVTDAFPYVLACFKGSPDTSFNKTKQEKI